MFGERYYYYCGFCHGVQFDKEPGKEKVCMNCGSPLMDTGVSSKVYNKLTKDQEQLLWKKWKHQYEAQEEKGSPCIMITSPSIEGRHIQRYLGVQHSELVLGIGLSNNVGAGLTDLFGLQDSSLSAKLHDAKKTALAQLKKQCIDIGANACISVDFDLMTLSGNIIVASASGTAVVLADEDEE